jgi:transcriptional regulator with XRE-family HTH domain
MREAAGLSQAEVVQKLDWSQSKLIRIENGSVGISVTDARALLSLYGAPAGLDSDLIELARSSRARTWWSAHREVLSQQHQEFLGFEADARRLRQFHPCIVPGLLQTEAYQRALIPVLALTPPPVSTLDAGVKVRLRRQAEILAGTHRPEITFIIDEAALRRPVGGARAMGEQLEHLAALQTQQDNRRPVSIAVLPFSAGPHIGMSGAFHIMDFADDLDDSVLYLESVAGELTLRDNRDLVAGYAHQFDQLLTKCLTGDRVADYLREVGQELAGRA